MGPQMNDSPLSGSLSWTALITITLLAALVESVMLFPSTLFPATRLATALSWDPDSHSYPSPETPGREMSAPQTPEPRAPASQTPTTATPAARQGEARVITGRVVDAARRAPRRVR